MEAVIKLAKQVCSTPFIACRRSQRTHACPNIQYYFEQKQPQRINFISRNLSYHGNTVGTLALSGHPTRRTPYESILNHEQFHHVSPAYAKRFMKEGESEAEYVERLRKELEDKFEELGPDTVIGCEFDSLSFSTP